MSISRIGFHYFSEHKEQIIRGIKYAERSTLNNPTDTCGRIALEPQCPKTVVIVRRICVSVYPFSPQFGQAPYWGWLKFNTRKNTYAQKSGSLLAMEDGDSKAIRLELWKDGECKNQIDFISGNTSKDDIETKGDIENFLHLYSQIAQFNKQVIDEIHTGQYERVIRKFECLQAQMNIPLFLPENWQNSCNIREETRLLIIAEKN